ncbi:protein kinase domain-containing protein [Verticillium alfalfae VaMs.102]|uniref:Protein kinase domain-containing protein n=1 Tax=Verticillium alfalfae (strain VaMs.102 / ATCC MYA-4576 / FGSC 10136) TaxID=526221 RepID=C9STK6_VERA1|nr:protein kinase domain-containing protein [Verticillium alfalfae VaMs.102]EEY22167.1 protein kinase domain-containing protein [Verticillium alfalfae VaMs.102]
MASTRDRSSQSTLATPRQFPSSGFELIDRAEKVEESQKYWALKVHVNDLPDHNQELRVYQHLAGANVTTDGVDEHPGLKHIRTLEDSFKIQGPHGVFIMTPLGMGLRTFQDMQQDKVFPKVFVTSALK